MSVAPEPEDRAPDAGPASDTMETFTETQILAFVRDVAAERDPAHADRYHATTSGAIMDACGVAQDLLAPHLRWVEEERARDIVLALSWLHAAYGLLPPSAKES